MASTTALGSMIQTARDASGKSRPDLSLELWDKYRIKADQSWIARIERGETDRPERDRLEALAELLGLDVPQVLAVAGYGTMATSELPDALQGQLLAWEPWELALLESELPGLRERYRAIRQLLGTSSNNAQTFVTETQYPATRPLARPNAERESTGNSGTEEGNAAPQGSPRTSGRRGKGAPGGSNTPVGDALSEILHVEETPAQRRGGA